MPSARRRLVRRGQHGGGGNRIPGIARQSLFASLGWVPPEGWRAGVEMRALGRIQANDVNTASAPGYAVAALYAGYLKKWERWEFNAFARVDNLFDRRYVGSVIVNEGNAATTSPRRAATGRWASAARTASDDPPSFSAYLRPAAARSAGACVVASQVNSGSSRPKWP
jgi:outer membrane receptor protein involved in Fe transport